MRVSTLLILVPALLGQAPEAAKDADRAARGRRERLLALYTREAQGYTIHRGPGRAEEVKLRREPVYVWTNPVRGGGQDGAVFVWTCRGRAEAIGCVFSFPSTGPRNLHHELHSLSLAVLDVTRPGIRTWTPQAPGIDPVAIPGAPAPARSAPQRLAQMRALADEFSATTEDDKGARWEQRLLPRPLYRDESTDPDVLDGALFAFVSSAGTDPEVLLVIEARRPDKASVPAWHYALARFSDMSVRVRLKGREVFSAPLLPWDAPQQDPKHRYRAFRDRGIPPVEDPEP